MCNINLSKLSPNLYNEAVKAAKENKVQEKIDFLVGMAAEGGFTKEEKTFLEGLASDDNVQKLKSSKTDVKSIEFAEPGFNYKKVETKPKSEGILDKAKQLFNDYAVEPVKQTQKGLTENTKQVIISNKIDAVESMSKDILTKLNKKLPSPNDQANFLLLYKKLGSDSKEQLKNLLDSKTIKLDAKDSRGVSLISNLNDLSSVKNKNQPEEKPVEKKTDKSNDKKSPFDGIGSIIGGLAGPSSSNNKASLVDEALLLLNDDTNIQQGYHGTCGAGALENYLRDNSPSELVRIVKDLSTTGKCTLADGKDKFALKVGRGSLGYEDSGRTRFDQIFQSAVMQSVAVVGGDERSDFWKNVGSGIPEAEYDVKNDDGSPRAVATGDAAADPYLLTSLMNRMLKGTSKHATRSEYNVGSMLLNLETPMDMIRSAVNKGKQCIACYKPDNDTFGARHYVAVNNIKKDPTDNKTYVYFKNTADVTENKMELSEFEKKLEFTIFPK